MKVFRKSVAIVGIVLSLFAASPVFAEGEMGNLQPKQVQMTLQNVNTANTQQLQEVKGIGPKIAEKIIQFIHEEGPITSMKELENVKGIGPKKREKIETKFSAE